MATVFTNLWVALIYLGVLVGSFLTFGKYYRRRKALKLLDTKQYYSINPARDIYYSLRDAKVPDKLLRAALLSWVSEDIARTMKMAENKQTLNVLTETGQLGDSLYDRYVGTEKLLARDLQEAVNEVTQTNPKWNPQEMVQLAREIAVNQALRQRMGQLDVFKKEYEGMLGPRRAKSSS